MCLRHLRRHVCCWLVAHATALLLSSLWLAPLSSCCPELTTTISLGLPPLLSIVCLQGGARRALWHARPCGLAAGRAGAAGPAGGILARGGRWPGGVESARLRFGVHSWQGCWRGLVLQAFVCCCFLPNCWLLCLPKRKLRTTKLPLIELALRLTANQVTELPDEVPEDWYLHAAQLAQQGQPVAATEASAAVGMGPATPAASGSSPLAAAGSWGEGGTGLLADIATASLWGEAEGEAGALLEPLPPPALPPPSPQQQQQQQEAEDAGIDLSYTVTPKPPAGTPVAVAAVAAGSGGAAGAAAAAGSLKGGSPATSPTSGKPLVSSLTAAVAAASSKASMAINVAAVASTDPVAVSQGNGNGNSHRYGDAAGCSSADSVDSWQSTSDDDYSSASSEDDATAAALAGGAPPPASFKPLRRVGSASSGSSAGSARSGGSSGGSSSGSSGRQASRPAPIPGRPQPAEQQLAGSYEGRSGGGLAEVASQASLGSLGSSEAAATAARVLGTSQEEEPSFRDSWLVEGEAQVEQSTAEQQRCLRLQRQAEAASAAAAPTVDLKPHRVRSPKAAAAQAAKAAARAKAAAAAKQAAAAQAAARQAAAQQQQRQQAQQAQQGHYWEVVRSVQQDVQGRLSGSGTSSGSAACKPAASHAAHAAAVEAGKQPVAIARAAAGGSSSEEEFEPVLPRQRRPLGSAQLVAARKRQEEVAASRAAEAAALELMAEQAAAAEAAAAQEAAAAAEAAAAQEAAAAAGSAAGADTAAAAAEQQRQWTEFWHAHYAYYGCYPGDATWQASSAADPAAAATGGQPAAAPCGVAAAAAATEAAGLLPPPPPAPPAPPPALSAAAWACPTPEYAAEQAGRAAAADGSTPGSGVAGTDGGWVQVPASLLARYQQLEWEQWQRSHAEWQQLWEQYKQVGSHGLGLLSCGRHTCVPGVGRFPCIVCGGSCHGLCTNNAVVCPLPLRSTGPNCTHTSRRSWTRSSSCRRSRSWRPSMPSRRPFRPSRRSIELSTGSTTQSRTPVCAR